MKSDRKDIYNVTKGFYFKQMLFFWIWSAVQLFLTLKGSWTEKSNFPWSFDIYEVIVL